MTSLDDVNVKAGIILRQDVGKRSFSRLLQPVALFGELRGVAPRSNRCRLLRSHFPDSIIFGCFDHLEAPLRAVQIRRFFFQTEKRNIVKIR